MASAASDQIAEQDARLLAEVPEVVCVELTMKATPAEDAGHRYVYIQASDETVDAQGEKVMSKALRDSADTFMRYGSLDLDHIVLMGPRSGLQNYMEYEIGRPVEVGFREDKTFVKAELYRGDGPLARNANMVWESLTQLSPPARWYPSVGGKSGSKTIKIDPVTKARVPVIESVYWTNLALSRTPVNQSVPCATTAPIGTFAKSLGGFIVGKSDCLTAGYGTDLNTLTGGGALRTQSLDSAIQSYWSFSEAIAHDLHKGLCGSSATEIADHAHRTLGLRLDKATAWASRFLADLSEALQGTH